MKSIHSPTAPACRLRGVPVVKTEAELEAEAQKKSITITAVRPDRGHVEVMAETSGGIEPVYSTEYARRASVAPTRAYGVFTGEAMTRLMTLLDALITAPSAWLELLGSFREDVELRDVVTRLTGSFAFEQFEHGYADFTRLTLDERVKMLRRIAIGLMNVDSWAVSIAGHTMLLRLSDRTA